MFYEIGERISLARRALGMTQTEFAKLIGCDFKTLSNWERGENVPRRRMLEKISAVTGWDIRYFLRGEEFKNPYWGRICDLADRQRAKGIATYDMGLEDNPAALRKRIEHLQEELLDGLMYCEWIKDKIDELEEKTNGSKTSSAHV